MEWVLFWGILAVIVGVWANNWGRSGFGFFVLSIVLSPLLSGAILLVRGKLHGGVGSKQCPDCAEYVQEEANICKHCSHEFK